MHHKSRLATKPGITGMWQVSGRSDITDFEEVVRLDTEYIEKGKSIFLFEEQIFGILFWYLMSLDTTKRRSLL